MHVTLRILPCQATCMLFACCSQRISPEPAFAVYEFILFCLFCICSRVVV
jgi:hypothetical protein